MLGEKGVQGTRRAQGEAGEAGKQREDAPSLPTPAPKAGCSGGPTSEPCAFSLFPFEMQQTDCHLTPATIRRDTRDLGRADPLPTSRCGTGGMGRSLRLADVETDTGAEQLGHCHVQGCCLSPPPPLFFCVSMLPPPNYAFSLGASLGCDAKD